MVRARGEPEVRELGGEILGATPGRRVDQAGLGLGGDPLDQPGLLLVVVDERLDTQGDLRAVEAADDLRRILEPQALGYLPAHRRRRGGRQRDDHRMAEVVDHLAQAGVVGAEVVAPAGDAVCLVHDEQGGPRLAKRLPDVVAGELLRSKEQELGPAVADGVDRRERRAAPALRVRRHRGRVSVRLTGTGLAGVGSGGGPGAGGHRVQQAAQAFGEPAHLVTLQRDERRDDHGRPRGEQGRNLVNGRLATPGRQDAQRVPAGGDGPHRLELAGAQLGEPEALPGHRPQQVVQLCVFLCVFLVFLVVFVVFVVFLVVPRRIGAGGVRHHRLGRHRLLRHGRRRWRGRRGGAIAVAALQRQTAQPARQPGACRIVTIHGALGVPVPGTFAHTGPGSLVSRPLGGSARLSR
ncbi:hypothetical protein FMEAI12_3080022 [Parafrankia sp. Ea1.12]|nr:hypothetical protein FMEAI12_3080022 [Parafrankia sp. Ea1.12]